MILGLFLVVFGTYEAWVKEPIDGHFECDSYDAIIIGAGLGGLSCAVPLAKQGQKILIIEEQDQLGGFYASFERSNSVLSAGVTDVTGCGNPGSVRYLLGLACMNIADYFVPISREIRYHGKKIVISGEPDALCRQLSAYFPHEKRAIAEFLCEAQAVYAESYGETVARFGVPLMPQDFIKAYGILKFPGYVWSHRLTGKWASKTFSAQIASWFYDRELRSFWEHLLEYAGLSPANTPAFMGVFAVIMPLINGSYYPRGGCQKLIAGLEKFLREHGVTILTGHAVDKLLTDRDGICGVRVGDRIYKSRTVVANVHARTVSEKLLDPTIVPPFWRESIKNLPLSASAVVVHMGFTDLGDGWFKQVAARGTHLIDLDTIYHLVINSNADRTVTPINTLSMTTFFSASYPAVPTDRAAYTAYKKTFVDRALDRIELAIPGARKHFVWSHVLTPRSFENWCGAPAGACYGFDLSQGGSLPSYKTPIRGLYLASASAQFGGGVEAVIMTGLTCAHDIMGWRS